MTFCEKLIKLRKTSGMSQEDLAAQIDVSRQAVSKWELGDAVPDCDKILALSRTFNVTTDYLLKDELETPTATIVMREDPTKKAMINKIFKFFSTLFYAIGLLASWAIWVKECNMFVDCQGRAPMGFMSILIGLLVQSMGIVCHCLANTFKKTKLSLWQIFLNLAFLIFIPLSAIFTSCIDGRTAPYPYYGDDGYVWTFFFWGVYVVVIGIIGLIFLICDRQAKKKLKAAQQNQ